MDLRQISISDFKNYFVRDFCYGQTHDQVMDCDIYKALNEARSFINQGIIPCNKLAIAFLYLTAHFLVLNIRMGFNGIQSVGQQIVQSNNITEVSESYAIPSKFVNNAIVNAYAKTDYGLKYLSIVLPNLIGHVGSGYSGDNSNVNAIGESPFGFNL